MKRKLTGSVICLVIISSTAVAQVRKYSYKGVKPAGNTAKAITKRPQPLAENDTISQMKKVAFAIDTATGMKIPVPQKRELVQSRQSFTKTDSSALKRGQMNRWRKPGNR